MAKATTRQDAPTLTELDAEVERLRAELAAANEQQGLSGQFLETFGAVAFTGTGPSHHDANFRVAQARKDAKWLEYQDALARRADYLRAREVEASTSLARTNTQLAGSQMWLASAITVATIGQLFLAFLTYMRGH